MSLTFGDIKDRVIFVDYAPGLHGTFVSYVINNLIYGTINNTNTGNNNNYHTHGGTPAVIYQLDIVEKDIQEAVVPTSSTSVLGINSFSGNLPIAWPIHWSNNLTNKGQSLDGFRVIELYAGPASVYRHLVNMMLHIGPHDAANPEYFVTNFYKIVSGLKYNYMLDDIPSAATYNFSEDEVVDILEKEIYNKHNNKYDTLAGIPWRRMIPHEQTFSIEVSQLYECYSFLQCIHGIDDLFRLNINIDEESLRVMWQEFIDKQWVIDLTKEKLHPLDQAYKNFLQKCQ